MNFKKITKKEKLTNLEENDAASFSKLYLNIRAFIIDLYAISRVLLSGLLGLLFLKSRFQPLGTQNVNWNNNSIGLVVLSHGLLSNPYTWKGYIEQLHKRLPELDIRASKVPYFGNCSLEVAATPSFDMLCAYAEKFPTKPIVLVGHSNGARINTYLETKLRSRSNPIHLVSIAGLHRGTPVINLINSLYPIGFFLSKDFKREAAMYSDFSETLYSKLEAKPIEALRSYCFIASPEDRHIPDTKSTLPQISHSKTSFYIAKGEGHVSILFSSMLLVCEVIEKKLKNDVET